MPDISPCAHLRTAQAFQRECDAGRRGGASAPAFPRGSAGHDCGPLPATCGVAPPNAVAWDVSDGPNNGSMASASLDSSSTITSFAYGGGVRVRHRRSPQRQVGDARRAGIALDAGSVEVVVAMEDRNQVLCARTVDYHEGTAAHFEKRAPIWLSRDERASCSKQAAYRPTHKLFRRRPRVGADRNQIVRNSIEGTKQYLGLQRQF
jgi:hypothetical protein